MNFPTVERCRLHDTIIDEETGTCDVCTAESEDCPKCGGETVITRISPDWGRRHCEEPFIEEPCGWCAQTGLKDGGA